MIIKSYKDLIIWQKSLDLTSSIYKAFSSCRDYGFKDQIQRASISIMNNIAEGYARHSDKSFRYFLHISKGSLAEVESMLFVSFRLGYISLDEQHNLLMKTSEVGKMLNSFIKKLRADG